MAVQSQVAKQNKNMTGIKAFNNLIGSNLMKTKIYQMVGSTDAQEFITSITSAVNNNPDLAECDAQSIISASLIGQSLHLKPSPQLGYFYMVPFWDSKSQCKKAQFQIGYKGYLQLAIRTGEYVDIDAIEIKQGEYKGRNKFTGKPEFEFIEDDAVRENLPVVGYMAYFEMKNGYIKRLYWSKEKMENHADDYSKAFDLNKYHKMLERNISGEEKRKCSSFWYKNFDEMAKKTMLRQLLSKHALLSTEMQKAVEYDQSIVDKDLKPHYSDNPIDVETNETEVDITPTVEEPIQQEEEIDPMMM